MEQPGSSNPSKPGTSTQTTTTTVPFDFDLNETPPPSPPEDAVTNDDGHTTDLRCDFCGHPQGEMVVCVVCVKHFHVKCLGGNQEETEWRCFNCSMECRTKKRLRRTVSAGNSSSLSSGLRLLDMNASPPNDDEVGVFVKSEYDLSFVLGNLFI